MIVIAASVHVRTCLEDILKLIEKQYGGIVFEISLYLSNIITDLLYDQILIVLETSLLCACFDRERFA